MGVNFDSKKKDLESIVNSIKNSWGYKTSIDAEKWVPVKPEYGQDEATSLTVNDILGGRIIKENVIWPYNQIKFHYYNETREYGIIDLTHSQFIIGTIFEKPTYIDRDE